MYTTTTTSRELNGLPSLGNIKMGIKSITHTHHPEGLTPRKFSEDLPSMSPFGSLVHPSTPPESASGSPRLKMEGNTSPRSVRPSGIRLSPQAGLGLTSRSRDCSPLPSIARLNHHFGGSTIRLPSLEEFDQGVEALARCHGPARPHTPPSPLPSLARAPTTTTTTTTTLTHQPLSSLHAYVPYESYPAYHVNETLMHGMTGLDGYPSPPPDGENRHINQKYTTEEGDFIIYAWHDKKFKWQRIKQDFAAMFGRTPERTVQGLQAWYYRMNQRIPLWDQDGWLIFDNEDELEPKYISIKCRERDSQDKPMEPLGLAQRYPERAIHYSWVDHELKRKAQDWAAKRALQYRERRERRKRKEQRRQKL